MNFKKIIKFICLGIFIMILFVSCKGDNSDDTGEFYFEYEINENIDSTSYVTITNVILKGNTTKVVIPKYIKGFAVHKILPSAFNECSSKITELVIPETVVLVEGNLLGFSRLSSITLPFVEYISNETSYNYFGYIFGTSNLSIPSSLKRVVITAGTKIGSESFNGCSNLVSISIPDSVTLIEKGAFSGCSSLESISVPFAGNSIDGSINGHFGYLFGAISGDLNHFYVPSSLKKVVITNADTIGSVAFYGCSNLVSISISDSVTSIEEGAFNGCSSLIDIKLPFIGNSKTAIADKGLFGYIFGKDSYIGGISTYQAYYNENKVTYAVRYYIPKSLRSVTISETNWISNGAFYNCSNLNEITISSGAIKIEENAFYNCTGLLTITIPDSVKIIEENAFSNCSSLESIKLPFIGNSLYGITNTHLGYIFGESNLNIPSSLKRVVVTGSISIGNYAFSECSNLTSITLPDSVILVGDHAFYNCSSLTSIIIPNNVLEIGEYAFTGCSSLTSAIISDCVKTISKYAFSDCSSISLIIIPNSVTTIGEMAFFGCSSLKGVIIGDGNISIGNYAFYRVTSLISVAVGNGKVSIGDYAFWGCSSLESIKLGKNITSIGYSAFYDCSSLKSIIFPLSLEKIDGNAFFNCSSLKKIIITKNVSTMGSQVFNGCKLLTIYCRVKNKPSGWNSDWNQDRPVVWAYTGR